MEPATPRRAATSETDRASQLQGARDGGDVQGVHGARLSAREIEILQLLADGCSNKEVSERLVVSIETVKTHVKHILAKLDARHRAQAVAIALRSSVIR